MDKYTVDLDQVLNDFEYSELTDQHDFDRPRSSNKQNSADVHNNFKNSNVKHSINNVFHSLNEYLNTEITTKVNVKADKNISGETSHKNNGEIIKNQVAVEKTPESKRHVTEEIIEDQPNVSSQIINKPITEEQTVSSLLDEPIENDYEPIIELNEQPISEESAVFVEPEPIIDVHTTDEPITDQVSDKSDESINDLQEETIETETINEIEDEEALDKAAQESIKQKTELTNETSEITNEVEKTIETNKVGFDDDIDVDESELHQYLEDLEKEYESDSKPEEVEEKTQNVEVEVVIEGCEIEKTDEETSNSRPNNLPLPNSNNVNNNLEGGDELNTKTIKNVINLIGDPGSTPYNNVYVNKELPPPTKEKGAEPNSDTDYSTSASPTFSDVSTETTSSATPSTDTVNEEAVDPSVGDVTQFQDNSKGEEGSNKVETVEAEVEENSTVEGEAEVSGEGPINTELPVTSLEQTPNDNQDDPNAWLGKQAPLWIPDADALNCMHCDQKFTVIKRRHHCRACGLVLCSKCCNLKLRLDYLDEIARVCSRCYDILSNHASSAPHPLASSSGSESNSPNRFSHPQQPNPNNPLEYCSTVPPHQQVNPNNPNPPSVMVPVGVLKRKGSNKARTNKSVMFCDGIRPGSDLTNLDNDFSYKGRKGEVREGKGVTRDFPLVDSESGSFMPSGEGLPPTVTLNKTDVSYTDCSNGPNVVEMLRNEPLIFALHLNLYVHVKIINMDCCINKNAWCFSTEGLINVGQDEIVILLELLDDENSVPKDIFLHINNIYKEAVKGSSVKEMGISLHNTSNFLGSKNHAGFVFIRPTFQCLQNVIKPKEPFLVGLLIHRWETPWAKLFPLRLVLRLGAEYRYYPAPVISNRYRDSVFVEIGHTIINLLADFRNFSYTLPQIRGLTIHMEDKNTTVTIPSNRYDQVMKSMNNSSDHILAFAGNFSSEADSHLVCIQDTQSNENAYSTHAINIHNKPRKVTGASFIVFNGALKSSSGLTAKSSIVEDGLMIQIPSDHMVQIRESLRNMTNHTIQCGCINAASDETVNLIWGGPDVNFNLTVLSPIDSKLMAGIPSIRVHNGKDYTSGGRVIRWTEVFIVQNEGEAPRNQEPVDISKVSETIAKAACNALVKYLDLLVSNSFYKIGIRANLNALSVAYSAGSNGMKLPPIYMESLDNELIPVLHRNTTSDCDDNTIILELIFRILQK